jgi:hypothetical protein
VLTGKAGAGTDYLLAISILVTRLGGHLAFRQVVCLLQGAGRIYIVTRSCRRLFSFVLACRPNLSYSPLSGLASSATPLEVRRLSSGDSLSGAFENPQGFDAIGTTTPLAEIFLRPQSRNLFRNNGLAAESQDS